VIIGSSAKKIYSFSVADGTQRWSTVLDDIVTGSPIIANGVVYVNSQKSLFALDAPTGVILWRAGVHTFGLASAAVSDGIVFIGSTDGISLCLQRQWHGTCQRLSGGELGVRPAVSIAETELFP